MNMFDEAKSLETMMKMRSLSQCRVAKMLGVSQSYVANKLRLLKLESNLQEKILSNGLSERHARALLRLDERQRDVALDKICERRLSVAESEALVDFLRIGNAPKTLGKANRLSHIDKFINSTKESLKTLASVGVNSTQKVNYFGDKILITICLEDEK